MTRVEEQGRALVATRKALRAAGIPIDSFGSNVSITAPDRFAHVVVVVTVGDTPVLAVHDALTDLDYSFATEEPWRIRVSAPPVEHVEVEAEEIATPDDGHEDEFEEVTAPGRFGCVMRHAPGGRGRAPLSAIPLDEQGRLAPDPRMGGIEPDGAVMWRLYAGDVIEVLKPEPTIAGTVEIPAAVAADIAGLLAWVPPSELRERAMTYAAALRGERAWPEPIVAEG